MLPTTAQSLCCSVGHTVYRMRSIVDRMRSMKTWLTLGLTKEYSTIEEFLDFIIESDSCFTSPSLEYGEWAVCLGEPDQRLQDVRSSTGLVGGSARPRQTRAT
ncbi:uncharacterized protein LDX57_005414 [Aspergillus melleus]|uniref:uncharacterized protein n=1 Tax=Aspergillus melleus TaxID=138277 RepID=UPI001E8D4FB5|nr:uncharacterized protein LDX57_005414 [Aspergillus melleus]KAH8427704.1 hypothetical protein LDX57_005414 [Aspergillus melleus]